MRDIAVPRCIYDRAYGISLPAGFIFGNYMRNFFIFGRNADGIRSVKDIDACFFESIFRKDSENIRVILNFEAFAVFVFYADISKSTPL